MGQSDLALLVLQKITLGTLEDAGCCTGHETCGVLAQALAGAARLYAHHSNAWVVQEFMKQTDRIRSASNASDEKIGQPPFLCDDLFTSLLTDNTLEVPHHEGVGVRTQCGPQ